MSRWSFSDCHQYHHEIQMHMEKGNYSEIDEKTERTLHENKRTDFES